MSALIPAMQLDTYKIGDKFTVDATSSYFMMPSETTSNTKKVYAVLTTDKPIDSGVTGGTLTISGTNPHYYVRGTNSSGKIDITSSFTYAVSYITRPNQIIIEIISPDNIPNMSAQSVCVTMFQGKIEITFS